MAFKLFDKLNSKGQLSVEFILILLVVLILIEVIILPLRDYSEASIKDITAISYLESNVNKIEQAIADLNTYSEGKLEVNLHIPEDSNFYLISTYFFNINMYSDILYSYNLKSNDVNVPGCDVNGCFRIKPVAKLDLNSGIDITVPFEYCDGDPQKHICVNPNILSAQKKYGYFFNGPLDKTLQIVKLSTGEIVIYDE